MEDIGVLKAEINSKLEMETRHLNLLRETLAKSSANTEAMLGILSSFETRLRRLNDTTVPVYQETENLRRRQENMERTLNALDGVLSHYHMANEVEGIIKDGPEACGLEEYLAVMQRILTALQYFTETNPGCPELSAVTMVFDEGADCLQREFKHLLNRNGKPVPPISILGVIAVDDELQSQTSSEGELVLEHMTDKIVSDLSEIARWLSSNANTTDFLDIYTSIRSATLIKSLQGLKEHLKATSGNSNTFQPSQHSPMLASKFRSAKDTPTRRSFKKIGLLKHALKKSPFEAGRRQAAAAVETIREESPEIETDTYITMVTALIKLVQSELGLLNKIIPDKHQRQVFDNIVQQPLEMLITEGEQIASNAKQAISSRHFNSVLSVFQVIRHLRAIKGDFDLTLEGCQAPTRSKLASLLSTLNNTGAKALEEFIDNIRNDPDKASNMPRDGTVHELTNHTIIFLEQLLEYIDTAGVMLLMHADSSGAPVSQDLEKAKMKLADYTTRVLSALGLNLSNKAETYSDVTLRAIFMLNNYNYVLKSLGRSGLLELIHLWNKDVEIYYKDQVLDQKKAYSQSWSRVLHFILDVNKPSPTSSSGKLKDKERQHIKDKFSGFNKELEEIYRIQKGYAIPDTELREQLKTENKEFILPKYRIFRDKYTQMNWTKNPEKYVKYTINNVSSYLDQFFDASA